MKRRLFIGRKQTASPSEKDLLVPVYRALAELGGTARNEAILGKVINDLQLSEEAITERYNCQASETVLQNKVSWCKTILKKLGLITNIGRGVWTIKYADELTELLLDDIASLQNVVLGDDLFS